MTKTGKIKQRENRKKKRQLEGMLIEQARENPGSISVSIYKEKLDKSFYDYAINETRREINQKEVGSERIEILQKVIKLREKLKR